MSDVEIGIGKHGRRAYGLDELSLAPSRRTRNEGDVDLSFELDAFRLPLPLLSAPIDTVTTPGRAIEIGGLGGLGVLNLEGLFTRHDDADAILLEFDSLPPGERRKRREAVYAAEVRPELIAKHLSDISAKDVVTCGAVSPQRAQELVPHALSAEVDVLVIFGEVVSAEHVRRESAPLDLASFIRAIDIPVVVGGCWSYQSALHLMRTGAIGVLVGLGSDRLDRARRGTGIGVPGATAIADAVGARTRHLEETGFYVQVIAYGELATSGDIAKALACGADAVMLDTALVGQEKGDLRRLLVGPAFDESGESDLFGGLRRTMALCGYTTVREFHKVDVVVAPRRSAGGGART